MELWRELWEWGSYGAATCMRMGEAMEGAIREAMGKGMGGATVWRSYGGATGD